MIIIRNKRKNLIKISLIILYTMLTIFKLIKLYNYFFKNKILF